MGYVERPAEANRRHRARREAMHPAIRTAASALDKFSIAMVYVGGYAMLAAKLAYLVKLIL